METKIKWEVKIDTATLLRDCPVPPDGHMSNVIPFPISSLFSHTLYVVGFTEVLLPSLNSLVPTDHNDNKTHERVI